MATEVKKDAPVIDAKPDEAVSQTTHQSRPSQDTSRDKFSNPGSTTARPPLPECFALDFFSPRSLHLTKTITVDPNQIENFANAVYQQQEQLCTNVLPITQANFARMVKTLVLKRVQDVHEKCFNQRANHFVRIYRNILVPKPIYDLMTAIGRGFNIHDGHHYYMSPIAQPAANPPDFWNIDNNILTAYQQFVRRMSPIYQYVEFPNSNDYDGRSIGCTRVQLAHGRSSVLASTPAPTPADGLLRILIPDAFLGGDVPAMDVCSYRLCDETLVAPVLNAYVGSSVLQTNS
jgi:hypothetical protein